MSRQLAHNIFTVVKVGLARLRFLAVFVAVALIVGYWDDMKNHLDKWTRPPVAPDALAQTVSNIEYYCVMHPNVIRSTPGDCPICGMPLAKRIRGEKVTLPEGVLSRVQLTPQRIALANIQTSVIEPRALVREIRTVGVLDYNETKVAQLSSRVSGRADELFVKSVGQSVRRGDPIYALYSPEVYTAQREYLLARKNANSLPADAGEDTRHDATQVYNASMQKLVLWGTTTEQLDKLDQEYDKTGKIPTHFIVTSPISGIVVRKNLFEGGYVQSGDSPYTVADLSSLWLQAQIFEQDVPLVKLGAAAEVRIEGLPNEIFHGVITFMAYQVDPTTRTLAARIEVPNPNQQLRPGMFADAMIRVPIAPVVTNATTAAATLPAPTASPAFVKAQQFQEALKPYLSAHELLTQDKTQNVSVLLHEMLTKLEPLQKDSPLADELGQLAKMVHQTKDQTDLEAVRENFRQISAVMIQLGKALGTPADNPTVRVFRCPMGVKPNWLQLGTETANPFQGSKMFDCGGPVEALPKIAGPVNPNTPASAERILAVPRSAVINTGRGNVVFVANAQIDGVYDLRTVTLGLLTGDYYPVLAGLEEGDRVVTIGAFLLDAENRLNPTITDKPTTAPAAVKSPVPEHKH